MYAHIFESSDEVAKVLIIMVYSINSEVGSYVSIINLVYSAIYVKDERKKNTWH